MGIAPRVLTAAELGEVHELAPERQWNSVLMRFAIKEAIYKALAPRMRRYIGFHEAVVQPHTDGSVDVSLQLEDGASPELEAQYVWTSHGLVATARARWP